METLIMAGQFLLSLSILIILHECGHFFPARWFNTRVEKFYLFFDPWFELFKFKKGDTEYGIGWLPLGGYVKISGMIDESFDREQMAQPPKPWEFRSKPAWQRLIIMLGGVTVNFILAVIVFAGILLYWGEQYLANDKATHGIAVERLGEEMGLQSGDKIITVGGLSLEEFDPREVTRRIIIDEARTVEVQRDGTAKNITVSQGLVDKLSQFKNKDELLFRLRLPVTVNEIAPNTSAAAIGLKQDDQILAIDKSPTEYYDQFMTKVKDMKNRTGLVQVLRNQDTLSMTAAFDSLGRLGFLGYTADHYYELDSRTYNVSQALNAGLESAVGFIGDQMKAFSQMFRGKIKASESLGSFISIGKMYGSTWDWRRFWSMTATLSALLGFVNLLPIPRVFPSYWPDDLCLKYRHWETFLAV